MLVHYGEPVKNKVVWATRQVRFPFRVQTGKSTPLGVFSQPSSKGVKLVNYDSSGLSRSSFLALPARFGDAHGNTYRWLRLKGIGLMRGGRIVPYPFASRLPKGFAGSPAWKRARRRDYAKGVVEGDDANHSRIVSEKFLKAGLRITPEIAHVRIFEYPHKTGAGENLRRKFPEGMEPKVVLTAFGCIGKVLDALDKRLVEKAVKTVKSELGKKVFSKREYAEWFASTLGENVGRMHSKGWVHNNLTSHNVTLDARLTDFDTVSGIGKARHEKKEFERLRKQDAREAEEVVEALWLFLDQNFDKQSLLESFRKSYRAFYKTPKKKRNQLV